MGKTEIILEAERTIKTAEFEGLKVRASVKEIIEWDNEQQREEKSSEVVGHLQKDFMKSYKMMVDTTGVQRSLGTIVKTKNGKPVAQANVTTDDEVDIFG